MHPIARCAEETLRAHPDPALRLAELIELMGERAHRGLTADRLRLILEQHPASFRILDALGGARHTIAPGTGELRPIRRTWVVALGAPREPPHGPGASGGAGTLRRLREGVRWLARGVDARSQVDVSRWDVIACTERETRSVVEQRAG